MLLVSYSFISMTGKSGLIPGKRENDRAVYEQYGRVAGMLLYAMMLGVGES